MVSSNVLKPAALLARFLFTERTSIKANGTFPYKLSIPCTVVVGDCSFLEMRLTVRIFSALTNCKQRFRERLASLISGSVGSRLDFHPQPAPVGAALSVDATTTGDRPYFLLLLPRFRGGEACFRKYRACAGFLNSPFRFVIRVVPPPCDYIIPHPREKVKPFLKFFFGSLFCTKNSLVGIYFCAFCPRAALHALVS